MHFSTYFEGKDWSEQTKEIYRTVQDQHAGGRWTEFPDPPVQNAVLEWLFRFPTLQVSKDLTSAEARRQLDIFIKRKSNVSGTERN